LEAHFPYENVNPLEEGATGKEEAVENDTEAEDGLRPKRRKRLPGGKCTPREETYRVENKGFGDCH